MPVRDIVSDSFRYPLYTGLELNPVDISESGEVYILSAQRNLSYKELMEQEARNIAFATIRHLSTTPTEHGRHSFSPRISGPVEFLGKLQSMWKLERPQLAIMLGLDPSNDNEIRDLLRGISEFKGRDLNDRFVYLFEIRMFLDGLLEDLQAENEWLREPHSMLEDRSPMDLLLEGSMRNLIVVSEYVQMACGL